MDNLSAPSAFSGAEGSFDGPDWSHHSAGPARRFDCLAELVNIAGEGMPYYLWTKMACPGQDPWEVGRDRARREQASFSYRNALIAEAGDQVVGTLIGYPLPDVPEPIGLAMPAMSFRSRSWRTSLAGLGT